MCVWDVSSQWIIDEQQLGDAALFFCFVVRFGSIRSVNAVRHKLQVLHNNRHITLIKWCKGRLMLFLLLDSFCWWCVRFVEFVFSLSFSSTVPLDCLLANGKNMGLVTRSLSLFRALPLSPSWCLFVSLCVVAFFFPTDFPILVWLPSRHSVPQHCKFQR